MKYIAYTKGKRRVSIEAKNLQEATRKARKILGSKLTMIHRNSSGGREYESHYF